MIKLENFEVMGWEHAIRGMRNPMNSWEKMDSKSCIDVPNCRECQVFDKDKGRCDGYIGTDYVLGPNDYELMTKLAKGGPVHAKYRRMITVYVDITAPLYWWKEFDTYKVGTVANSCSTMHKIHAKEFTIDDFSHEHLRGAGMTVRNPAESPWAVLHMTIDCLNIYRDKFLEAKKGHTQFDMIDAKDYWYQMIQLLPTSYNQKRTVMLNYEVLTNIYESRKNHKLDEWHTFCDWIEELPYHELITGSLEVKSNG